MNMIIRRLKIICYFTVYTYNLYHFSIVGAIFAAIIILATAYDVIIQHFLQKQPKLYEKVIVQSL
jgi:hypothetical protein